MKPISVYAILFCWAVLILHSSGATFYVDQGGLNPTPPFAAWSTAATNIQDAVNAASAGDTVLVTNGVYAYGGISTDGLITNRVSVVQAMLVQSVNGPAVTVIQGAWDRFSTNGPGAVRCAWLTNNAVLSGFTLCGGATRSLASSPNSSMEGGGVFGTKTNALVYNCILATNYASYLGGGAFSVTVSHSTLTANNAVGSTGSTLSGAGSGGGAANCNLINCLVTANIAAQSFGGGAQNCNAINCAFTENVARVHGGGVYQGSLLNCTVAGNTSAGFGSSYGGAVMSASLTNCIVYGNSLTGSGNQTNYYSCTFSYSDTDPLPSGYGNVDVNPQLLADGFHLAATSPCIGAGTASMLSGAAIDGNSWNNPPSVGCVEWQPAPIIAGQPTFQVSPPNHLLIFSLQMAGQPPFSGQWNHAGGVLQDGTHYTGSTTTSLLVSNFTLADVGGYQVVISNAFGSVTSQVAQVVMHAVAAAGTNPVRPYFSWATAATNIQDAVDAASPGDIVLVTNGIYAWGGRRYANGITNRVLVTQPGLAIIGVNGYASTIIQGARDPHTTTGALAVRCCFLATNNVSLTGFTLQGGATSGGALVEYDSASNDNVGGGVASVGKPWPFDTVAFGDVEVNNCVIISNTAGYFNSSAGGVYGGDGGGASYVNLNNCILKDNSAYEGGGTYNSQLTNCTVSGNQAVTFGGGTSNGDLYNCISFNNYAGFMGSNSWSPLTILNSCTTPAATGYGNISADPQFVDAICHLSAASPCIGAGSSLYSSGVDIDGEAWNLPPSMGADEVYPADLPDPCPYRFNHPNLPCSWGGVTVSPAKSWVAPPA
jgi:hypothetical protein